jgi:hypothetical protein
MGPSENSIIPSVILLWALQEACSILHDSRGVTVCLRKVESALGFPGVLLLPHAWAIRIQIAAWAMHHVLGDQFKQLWIVGELRTNVFVDVLNEACAFDVLDMFVSTFRLMPLVFALKRYQCMDMRQASLLEFDHVSPTYDLTEYP